MIGALKWLGVALGVVVLLAIGLIVFWRWVTSGEEEVDDRWRRW